MIFPGLIGVVRAPRLAQSRSSSSIPAHGPGELGREEDNATIGLDAVAGWPPLQRWQRRQSRRLILRLLRALAAATTSRPP